MAALSRLNAEAEAAVGYNVRWNLALDMTPAAEAFRQLSRSPHGLFFQGWPGIQRLPDLLRRGPVLFFCGVIASVAVAVVVVAMYRASIHIPNQLVPLLRRKEARLSLVLWHLR
jgi:hypothetical protein